MQLISILVATAALLPSTTSAISFKLFADRSCTKQYFDSTSIQLSYNGTCQKVPVAGPANGGSLRTNLHTVGALTYAHFYTDDKCLNKCDAKHINNDEPDPEYPIADGACVAAPPLRSKAAFKSFRIFTTRSGSDNPNW